MAEKDILPSHATKQSIFPFFRLPRELRNPIYRECINSGAVEILQVSKAVHDEASEFFFEQAVLRINLGFLNCSCWSSLRPGSIPSVQHLELRIRLSANWPYPITQSSTLLGFLDKRVLRESCVVTLYYVEHTCPPRDPSGNHLFQFLVRLNGFKKVTVRIEVERWTAAECCNSYSDEEFQKAFPYDTELVRYHKVSYERVKKYMETGLGSARFDDSVEGHCLEFRPLGYSQEGGKLVPEEKNEAE